jgi:hypothetical protein
METPNGPTKCEYYDIYRKYRLAEQNLLNNRLTWNLTIQGFLFATYGLSSQKQLSPAAVVHLTYLVEFIPWIGLVSSAALLLSVVGAMLVLLELNEKWKKLENDNEYKNECNKDWRHLPNPAGAGVSPAFWLGLLPPLAIPTLSLISWGGLLWILR